MQHLSDLRSKTLLPIIVSGLAITAVGCTAPAAAPAAPQTGITVSGYGEASGSPDVAYIDLGIDVANSDVDSAVAEANQAAQDITEALIALGIPEADIQTRNFSVYPEERFDPETGEPTGQRTYRVNNTVNVKVAELSQVSDVIDTGLEAGANQVWGLNFAIEDSDALESAARDEAIADARARAEEMAEGFGVTLGEPIAISEGAALAPPVPFFGAADVAESRSSVPISPGELSVSSTVTVTFAVR